MKNLISLALCTIAMHTEFFWVIALCLAILALIHWKVLFLVINKSVNNYEKFR